MKRGPVRQAEEVSRRRFLGYLTASIMAFIAAVLGFLGIGPVFSPAFGDQRKEWAWIKLGPVSEFAEDIPRKVDFTLVAKDAWLETGSAKSVWVVAQPQGGFTVFNSRCTHLGCIVDWETEKAEPFSAHHWKGPAFYSPCHAGVFDIDGTVLAGPPPRPLDTLQWKIAEGNLLCRYQDFVVGIPEKRPV